MLAARIHGVADGLLDAMPDDVRAGFPFEVFPGVTKREVLGFVFEAHLYLMLRDEAESAALTNILFHLGHGESEEESAASDGFIRAIAGFVREGVSPIDDRAQDVVRSFVALYGIESGFDPTVDGDPDAGDGGSGGSAGGD